MRLGACPLCDGRSLAALPVPRRTVGGRFAAATGLGLRRCRGCGFEFVDPRPDDASLAAFYQAQDYTAHEPVDAAAAQRRARIQLDAIEAAVGDVKGATVLDVGCGGGQLLAEARARGAVPCGVDVAAHAQAACRTLGIEVVAGLDELRGRSFDGAVMSHVLEHVPDVRATLGQLRALTGWLAVEVPNVRSLRARLSGPLARRLGADERHRAFPIHLSYFAPATLARALEDAGFAVVAMTTAVTRRPATTLKATAKEAVKRAYYDRLLGENLLAVARIPRG